MTYTKKRVADAMTLASDACGGVQKISHAQHSRGLSAVIVENSDLHKICRVVHIAPEFVIYATHMVERDLLIQGIVFGKDIL
jgi:hypothetical protein